MEGTERIVVMAFGAVIAVVGLVMLFRGRGGEGRNAIKAFGAEFDVANSGVVVFLVGAALFVAPWLIGGGPMGSQPTHVAAPVQAPSQPAPPSSAPASSPATATPAAAPRTLDETEPNDDFARAMPVALGSIVRGQLNRDDVDVFRFHTSSAAQHNVRVRAEFDSKDVQMTLRIYDADKRVERDVFVPGYSRLTETLMFLAKPDSDYFVELENRKDWAASGYTLTLSEN